MKTVTKLTLSLSLGAMLLTGCGSNTTPTPKVLYGTHTQESVSATASMLLQSLAVKVDTNETFPATPADPYTLHIGDGDLLHLVADEEAMGVTGTIASYRWTDMAGNVLSETKNLDRVLYYDPQFDHDDNGTTKYIKTITITTTDGKTYRQSYTVWVHKAAQESGQAVLGPLAQATFRITKLRTGETVLEGVTTAGDGNDVTTAGRLLTGYDFARTLSDGYYLVTVAGGQDIDRDDDLQWDTKPTINKGVLHAIIDAAHLGSGHYKVNVFTQAIYQYLNRIENIQALTDASLKAKMDALSAELLREDLNGDGVKDYADILLWNPATDKAKLTIDYAQEVEPYVQEILAGVYNDTDLTQPKRFVVTERTEGDTIIHYTYDRFGNVVNEIVTDKTSGEILQTKIYTNRYDAAGRLVSQKLSDPKIETRWSYDAQGNITQKEVGLYDADTFTPYAVYTYANGKLVSGVDNRSELPKTYTYETDRYGNVVKETMQWQDQSFVTTYRYEYDDAGHIIKAYKNGELWYEQRWEQR